MDDFSFVLLRNSAGAMDVDSGNPDISLAYAEQVDRQTGRQVDIRWTDRHRDRHTNRK